MDPQPRCTHTTREGMAGPESPQGMIPTASPGDSTQVLRTLIPLRERSTVYASCSVLESSQSIKRLIGILLIAAVTGEGSQKKLAAWTFSLPEVWWPEIRHARLPKIESQAPFQVISKS